MNLNMNRPGVAIPLLPIIVVLVPIIVWIGTSLYRRYTGLSRSQSALLFLVGVSGAIGLLAYDNQVHA